MLELAIVMPVYNEEACIVGVVDAWVAMLETLGVTYRVIVLNDGSRDQTAAALARYDGHARVQVIHKANSGHGPTILAGYRLAVDQAAWVFQCDSDDEMKAEHFPRLWEQRAAYEILFGIRDGRQQPLGRRLISAISRLVVRCLFAAGVRDVNTPYRLMRADLLRQVIAQIPDDTFAPNVIIAGTFARAGARIFHYAVPHENRKTGTVSIMKWKLWRAAFRAFRQTLGCRPTLSLARAVEAEGGA